MSKTNLLKPQYSLLLVFFPLYFSSSGIYQSVVSETGLHLGETGLVFPLSLFVGILFFLYLLFQIILLKEIKKEIFNNFVVKQATFIFLFAAILMLCGVFINGNFAPIIRGGQIISGGVGIVISVYIFIYKQINPKVFFGYLGLFFVLIMILNYISSFLTIGISSFGPSLQPSIFGVGIYQSRVYYPYIVSLVCFMGLPFLKEKFNRFIPLYLLLFGFYIYCLQVRGALLSFLIVLLVAIIFYLDIPNKILMIVTSIFFVLSPIGAYVFDNLGRIGQIEKIQDLNGRTEIWKDILLNLDLVSFFFGSFMLDKDGVTAHNQYLQNLDLGGVLLLTPLILIITYIFICLYKSVALRNQDLSFLFLVFLIVFLVDLNVNVPLSNTNPAIVYWFYLSGLIYYFNRFVRKKEWLK
ncbi:MULTISPECIES: hypothetical protein [Bhargavaea]|uniref:O-antigen ligase like membrane protein n=1 Tax=Bhargavaea changchunensis TaxID=2134037 RepID=A0ABW2NGB3_9BACL|nr:hypothetical protein [Bhargavaea sp. CC-171006]